jgi:cephalosporin hydroxylase
MSRDYARPVDEQVVADFARLYWEAEDRPFFHNRFMGVPTLQHPFDAWVTQEIIFETKPEVIVECGTCYGGSAIMWALLLEQVHPEPLVVTIDPEANLDEAEAVPIWQRRVHHLAGSSIDPEIVDQVHGLVGARRCMVILDSLHTLAHVSAELDAYADLVSEGCYLIVQDGFVNGHPLEADWGPGPFEAIEMFLGVDDRFDQDRTRERMLFTFNPGGFLRRR